MISSVASAATPVAAQAEQDEDALVESAAAVPKAMRKAVVAHRKAILGTVNQAPARRALESAMDRLEGDPV